MTTTCPDCSGTLRVSSSHRLVECYESDCHWSFEPSDEAIIAAAVAESLPAPCEVCETPITHETVEKNHHRDKGIWVCKSESCLDAVNESEWSHYEEQRNRG